VKKDLLVLGRPTPDLLILTLLGSLALVAQITLSKAYQLTLVSLIALYTYSQIMFASVFRLLFLKEIPDVFSVIGASCIMISGYSNYRLKSNN